MGDEIQVKQAHTFEDLLDEVVTTIKIPRPGGVIMAVPVKELSYGEWFQVEIDDPKPLPPINVGAGGKKIRDTEDETYKKQCIPINERWMKRRVLLAINKVSEENRLHIPGANEDEQLAELEKIPMSILTTLYNTLANMHGVKVASVDALAETFPTE